MQLRKVLEPPGSLNYGFMDDLVQDLLRELLALIDQRAQQQRGAGSREGQEVSSEGGAWRIETLGALGEALSLRSLHEDAAVAYAAAGRLEDALQSYRAAGSFQMALALAGVRCRKDYSNV